ncbi:hypothetical protein CHCC20375_2155 [Bacillus licheniformis]|nr:hypothetical protein CHCC20375_2155 [Bacillus licheniformis]
MSHYCRQPDDFMQKTPKSPETYAFTQIKKAFSAGLRKLF